MTEMLRSIDPADVLALRQMPIEQKTMAEAEMIVEDVRRRGEAGLRDQAVRLGDIRKGGKLIHGPVELAAAAEAIDPESLALLQRIAGRIRAFAEAQRDAILPMTCGIPGGMAGHELIPVDRAGCYAPAGRYPLPSSVLMTAVTARAAGVGDVMVASPVPSRIMLAAAHVAGANSFLAAGGAQAIAAMAYGAGAVQPCDAIVGPGNRWVTAAKQLVSGIVRIDMLAGPSELVVLADDSADPGNVAADLLAQAEHDEDARAILVTTSPAMAGDVNAELQSQLATLPTSKTAAAALARSYAIIAADLAAAAEVCNLLAPEHLQVVLRSVEDVLPQLRHYGAIFIGAATSEVLGDYGAGPNHVLPTGGTARFAGGLSIMTFLRMRTWMQLDDLTSAADVIRDAEALARMEGLEAHARAAQRRLA